MLVNINKLHSDVITPTYATDGAACFDLHAHGLQDHGVELDSWDDGFVIGTGLVFEIPPGHVMKVFSRSGHGFKYGVRLSNCVGVIDSDYRGEVKIKLFMDDNCGPLVINNGDRIAQAMIVPVERVGFQEVATLTETDRGTGGFGSTGS